MSAPTNFAEAEVRLAEALPGYESRAPQQTLAAAVSAALESGTHLLAQAGTGTGKSLGYLIPSILSGQRVIISTATKALQDQIAGKDLPFLSEHLGVDFTWALLKGRSNYICPEKAQSVDPADVPNLGRLLEAYDNGSWDGSRDKAPIEIPAGEWMKVAAESEECGDLKCREDDRCAAERAKRVAKAARVVVVNHSLFLTDLALKAMSGGEAGLIDNYDAVVFDEAHEVESYASNVFGEEFKESGLRGLCTEVLNFARRHVNHPETEAVVTAAVNAVLAATTSLWAVIEVGRVRLATIEDHADEWIGLANALGDLAQILADRRLLEHTQGDLDAARKQKRRLSRRAANAVRDFSTIITADFDRLVRWVEEERGRKNDTYRVLKSAPVDVSDILRPHLFDPAPDDCPVCGGGVGQDECYRCGGSGLIQSFKPACILTSATLAVAGKGFGYIAGRLGIDSYTDLDVGTPFDYHKQALLYVPTTLPEPTPQNRQSWSNLMRFEIINLVKASKGRALILFTSNKEMRNAYEAIADHIPYEVRMQGQATNPVLSEWFKENVSGVLFATRSFFTGVDFQGETLSLVVMDKLPFPVPNDPIVEARCDAIEKSGGSPFKDYVIPEMSLTLLQGFGRLIRHRNDLGTVAILDPRLKTKGYGTTILRALPDAKEATSLQEVEEFFA